MDNEELLEQIDRRLADRERHDDRRHSDLVRRFENLDGSLAKAHGRISTQEGILARVERRVEQVAKRYHELSNRMTRLIHDQIHQLKPAPVAALGDNQLLSRLDAKWIITLILGSIGGTLATLKFFGKLG